MKSLSQALYRHPAFLPHRLLRRNRLLLRIGLASFWTRNTVVTIFFIILLTLCAWRDHSFTITNGFGYFEHPGIFGWYLIQLVMPVAIYSTLKLAARSEKHYRKMIAHGKVFNYREKVFKPMVAFIGFDTPASRAMFAILFLIGFAEFAWNTFQNLHPGKLAPLDFWDSINFSFGYFGTRVYKFYMDALLLPSIVHVFAGVVWTNINAISLLSRKKEIQLAPFNTDRCGGFRFLADLILSPTISALLVSGLAFFGVVYTHRAFDVATIAGTLVQVAILVIFYVAPTFVLRSVIVRVKKLARQEVHSRQEMKYEAIMSGKLRGASLRDAHEYLRYFNDISTTIDKIPNWPHLARVSRVFGISISPGLISLLINVGNTLRKFYLGQP